MHSENLKEAMQSGKPVYIMFVDADPKGTSIIASCTLSLALFASGDAFFNPEDPNLNSKRSVIQLYDQLNNHIAKVDATISLSLLDEVSVKQIEEKERQKST